MDRFDLRAIKLTEYVFQVSVTKAGVTEADIRLGINNGSVVVDPDAHEIRHGDEVWAKFGDVQLPVHQWKLADPLKR